MKKVMYIILIVIIISLVFAYGSEHTKLTTAFNYIDSLNIRITELEKENSNLKSKNKILAENMQELLDKEPVESVAHFFPWLKSREIDSCVVSGISPYHKTEIEVPREILDALRLEQLMHNITRTYTIVASAPSSDVNCYRYTLIINGNEHTIENLTESLVKIDNLYLEGYSSSHYLGDALFPKQDFFTDESLYEKIWNSSLMTVKYNNHTNVDIRKHKIRTVVHFRKWDIAEMENIPNDLGDTLLEMTCYNHGETVSVKAYEKYITIIDDTTGEKICFYSEDMNLAETLWDYYFSAY